MKTILKVGMEVYDQVNFPDSKGKVTEIERDVDGYWYIRVVFKGDDYFYHMDGSFGLCSIPTLSTKPYKVALEGFEQKAPAPTFENALDWLDNNENYQTVFEDERTYPSKEIYEAFEALRKLIILRDYYNEGWKPDFKGKSDYKFCIVNYCGDTLSKDKSFSVCGVMVFKTEEIRDKFLEEHRELLEIAKPLL